MLKLETDISAGRLNGPAGDNAMETLQRILTLVTDAKPSDLDAIDSMPARFDQLAAEARARGDKQAAERLSVFRDAFGVAGRGASAARNPSTPNAPVSPLAATAPPRANSMPPAELSAAIPPLERDSGREPRTAVPGVRPATIATSPNPVQVPVMPIEPEQAKSDPAPGIAGRPPGSDVSVIKLPEAKPESAALLGSRGSRRTEEAALPKPAQVPNAPVGPVQAESGTNTDRPASASVTTLPVATITFLLKRADKELLQGDILAARLLFQRAAEAPSGAGAAGVAKTYDPVSLAELGAIYTQADARLATEWYRKAIALGEQGAAASLSKLEKWEIESAEYSKAQQLRTP